MRCISESFADPARLATASGPGQLGIFRMAILGDPFIGRAPVDQLAAIGLRLDRGRNSDFDGLGLLIVGRLREGNEGRSRLPLWLLGLRNNAGALNQARPCHLALDDHRDVLRAQFGNGCQGLAIGLRIEPRHRLHAITHLKR